MLPFYQKHKGSLFMAQVRTKIGIGNVFGHNEDNSQFMVAFKKSELTPEYLQVNNIAGNIINLWVNVEDIYEITNVETEALPKRIVPSKYKKRKK